MANEVVPTGQSVERARAIARDICRRPMTYLQYHKERVFQSLGVPLAQALATEQRYPPHESEDYRRGLQASLAAKLPGWPAHS
jgi:enoyl-CoA hydratase/carnithine racemase